ncbi:MAG: hypothetical protein ABSE86_00945 [Bryobacteraceae bacterium]|jgi:homospermidine synthase
MATFPNRVLLVGFGAVARCTLPILIKHFSIDPRRVTTIDYSAASSTFFNGFPPAKVVHVNQ